MKEKDYEMDPKQIIEIMDAMSSKIPPLIKGIVESFYSPETATQMAKSIAAFRATLIEGGIPDREAMQMTREYMATLTNLSKTFQETESSGKVEKED